jgi:hypothetical protein
MAQIFRESLFILLWIFNIQTIASYYMNNDSIKAMQQIYPTLQHL